MCANFFFWGGRMGISQETSFICILFLNLYAQISLAFFPSSAHTSTPEAAGSSSQPTPNGGNGVETGDSWASARSSC